MVSTKGRQAASSVAGRCAAALSALCAAFAAPPGHTLADPLPQVAGRAAPAPAADTQPQGIASQAAQAIRPERLFTVMGTPHLWLADDTGALRWIGDTTALARVLYPPRQYTLEDPLSPLLRRTLDTPEQLSFEQLMQRRRGAPLLSTAFVRLDGEVYYPRWEPFETRPVLQRVPGAGDLEVLAGTAGGAPGGATGGEGPLILEAGEWEQRFGVPLAELKRGELRGAAPPRPTPLPCTPFVASIAPEPNGASAELHNPCGVAMQVRLSAALYDAPGGQPLQTTRGKLVSLQPGETLGTQLVVTPPRPARPGQAGEPGSAPEAGGESGGAPPPPAVNPGWALPLLSAAPAVPASPEQQARIARLRELLERTGRDPNEVLAELEARPDDEQAPEPLCIDVGAAGCLIVDPWMRQAVEILQGMDLGRSLLATAADFGVTVRRAELFGNSGQYDPRSRTITMATSLDQESDWERAAILAHELQHARDHASGIAQERGSVDCLAREREAFRAGGAVWRALWKGSLPRPRSSVQEMQNRFAAQAEGDSSRYDRSVARLYLGHCYR
jgi:hypothetical protein